MITCTLTRPSRASIINPVNSHQIRLNFVDDIDIAFLAPPKPRTITLSPLPRRTRTRSKRSAPNLLTIQPIQLPPMRDAQSLPSPQGLDRPRNQPVVDLGVARTESEPPRSPGPSETSFESGPSSGETPSAVESISQVSQSGRTNDSGTKLRTQFSTPLIDPLKPITTIIKLDQAGYLRGDTVEVHVSIDHTKQIKSLHGVIVTLYRQARVDFYPSLPIINRDDDSSARRRMVLRGIAIASGSSFHIFRKVLDQNFSAIIIDDKTMKAEVKTSISIPENAFPTISTVPGAMISFKYYVEVICDIQGKLSAYDKYLPTPGASSLNGMRNNGDGAHSGFPGWSFIDTEEIKREKSVVCCNFEVIVGSRDSSRNGNWSQLPAFTGTLLERDEALNQSNGESSSSSAECNRQKSTNSRSQRPEPVRTNTNGESSSLIHTPSQPLSSTPPPHFSLAAPNYESVSTPTPSTATPLVPIPTLPDESNLSEKERIRLAEQRLLPSAPSEPAEDAYTSSSAQEYTPSAPRLTDLDPLIPSNAHHHLHHPYTTILPQHPSHPLSSASAPPYAENSSSSTGPLSLSPIDDKQELERRRLEEARSSPPPTTLEPSASSEEVEPDATPRPDRTGEREDFTPTAPVIHEDEAMFGFTHNSVGEVLPKYER
jgi:arrestin-related trafficking adapter 9